MATFSAAQSIALGSLATVIPSSNGSVDAATVVFTAAVSKKTVLTLSNFFNQLAGGNSVVLNYQRKDPQSGSYVTIFQFTVSGTGGASAPCLLSISAADRQLFIDYNVNDEAFSGTLGASGGVKLIMLPEDRLTTQSGTTTDGNSGLRICGRYEEYFAAG